MKNYNSLLLALFLMSISISANAQLGLRLGTNLAWSDNYLANHPSVVGAEITSDVKRMRGIHLGPTLEINFSEKFSLETGAIFTMKGFKQKVSVTTTSFDYGSDSEVTLLYVDVPMEFKRTWDIGTNSFYAFTGPYLGIGLIGFMELEENISGDIDTKTETLEFSSSDSRRLEGGITIGGGIELGRNMRFGISYNHGLTSILKNGDKFNLKNRVFNITMGFKFKRKVT